MNSEAVPSPFPVGGDGKFWDEFYALVEKYGFHQCAIFVAHKEDNDTDTWQTQSNAVSEGMLEHIEFSLVSMRQHLEKHTTEDED